MSIKLENLVLASPEQMSFIIQGLRNPMNSHDRSDSEYETAGYDIVGFNLGENDHSLMQRLANAGTDHRKFMRMMPVYVRITAPLYWWKEFDTYKVGTVANSCSTMHKIQEKEFTLEDFSTEHLRPHSIKRLVDTVESLNYYRDIYLNGGTDNNLGGDVATVFEPKDKDIWWQLIQLLPSSYNQTRNVMLNYEVLANIYKSRKDHKLDEWREFCKWIESLPYSELIIGFKICDIVEYGKAHPEFVEKMNKIAASEKDKTIETINLYGQLVPRKGIVSSSNYNNAVFHGEN